MYFKFNCINYTIEINTHLFYKHIIYTIFILSPSIKFSLGKSVSCPIKKWGNTIQMTNDRPVYIIIDPWLIVYRPIIGYLYCMPSFFIWHYTLFLSCPSENGTQNQPPLPGVKPLVYKSVLWTYINLENIFNRP